MTTIDRAIVSTLSWAFVGGALVREGVARLAMSAEFRRNALMIAFAVAVLLVSGYAADKIGQEACGHCRCCRECIFPLTSG